MSVRAVAELEREVILTHLQSRWTRSHMATEAGAPPIPDPGWGKDPICPILYYQQPFDPSNLVDVAALSTYAVEELRGLGYYELDVQDGTWAGQQLPLRLKGLAWVLETLGGPVNVLPQSAVEPGVAVVFDVEGGVEPSFTAAVSATYLHGVGFVTINLAEPQVEAVDVGSTGSLNAKTLVRIMIACAPPAAPKTAELYAAAIAHLYRGVMWCGDETLPEGDLRRDMADSGIIIIRQYHSRDPVQERPNRVSEHSGWAWFVQQFILRRQYRLAVQGSVNVMP